MANDAKEPGSMERTPPGRVVILGGGLLGATADDLCRLTGHETVGFLDNRKPVGQPVYGGSILGPFSLVEEDASLRETCGFIVAVSDAPLRRAWIDRIRAAGGRLVSLIHPAVHCADSARLGEGLLIHAFTAIYPGAVIGDGCVLETQVAIGPEVSVGPICLIAAGVTLCNRSNIGSGSFIGTRTVVCPAIVIGPGCVVGANSTVNRNLPPYKMAIGSPARVHGDNLPPPADAESR